MTRLLRTVHGSRLYGLHHADSAYDWFEVHGWDKSRSKQKITGDQDTVRTSLDSFLWNCNRGVPQFLEAMFSQQCTVNEIPFITEAYRPAIDATRITYRRTIKKLWLKGVEENNVKFKRHAVRMHFNLEDMQGTGRFNPTLNDFDKQLVHVLADMEDAFGFDKIEDSV